ncbi:PREDICTED: centrosome-associated protein 350-like [Dufourea novaeangliae]|uniref:centrosome-associated protein 350-like n=1 Tax=Dufourea novaeangliae TaxID=178035 RepID=UPI000767A9AB|nr:PREDICTED: centrosome-associated protein 350-like [Dufourea novaeangliae]
MKSSSKKEDTYVKKKYVFFSDPDVIIQRAESSAAATQVKQGFEFHQQQTSKEKPSSFPTQFDLKSLKNLLYHPVQPYPFTFISAVKRKLALEDHPEICKQVHNSNYKNTAVSAVTVLKSKSAQNLHEIVQKMDFIRPLKVPDLKISAKKLDFTTRENSVTKELMSSQFEVPSKEFTHDRTDKPTKSFERVQRRLDFSTSDVSSIIASEIEPLKVPNISISSTLSKKKEYIRENCREKENRSKRIRKDDCSFIKQDETGQEFLKRSRNPRHVSRKDCSDNISEIVSVTKLKNDRLPLHMPRESDFVSTKPKTKNFATSTAKKDTDKKHRSINVRSLKSRDTSLESKNRTFSNESLSERSSKLPDKITIRESRNMFENCDYRYKEDLHSLKQADDQKYVFSTENRQIKQQKVTCQSQGKAGNTPFKEQIKRAPEKVKPSTSKLDGKMYTINSREFDDVENITDSNTSTRTQSLSTTSMQKIKSKDTEKVVQNIKSNKTIEDPKYTDISLQQCTSTNTRKEEESFTQSIITTIKQTSNSNESNLNDSIVSDVLLDPRRISFRDENRSQQEEFCDLVTPNMNLLPRSRRKRQFIQNSNVDNDSKCIKHNTTETETEQESMPLLHPTALHMQFQAELHLLDSFNESLRQVMDVEKCLYTVKQDQGKEVTLQHNEPIEQSKLHFSKAIIERNVDDIERYNDNSKSRKHVATDRSITRKMVNIEILFLISVHHTTSQIMTNDFDNSNKINKPAVKAVEVQTQTVNDMATQTEIRSTRRNVQSRCSEICGIPYEREFVRESEVPQLSLDSAELFEDLDQIEEISLPSKLRTMSEISLHETTSSIRTETGTEISISTRDITCSFNKYLDLQIAQLIKDEKQRYDKIEMLFKSREKTLNDRTKKLVKLEEQKRALRDTGQDSRVSSVKKKQRALLLKLQQEKDEMNRLKELHKIASQERKRMLQKQRNMFNPQMSTKNILTKLKRRADSQSPRRLSGPMKGYDIRSNSSMSSLVDSDKSQHDRSQNDARIQMSENELQFAKLDLPKINKFTNFTEESRASFIRFDKPSELIQSNMSQEKCPYKQLKDGNKLKYEIKSKKFEEKMPRADILRLKLHQHSIDPKLISGHSINTSGMYHFEKEKSPDVSELLQKNLNNSVSEHAKSESDTLVEELSKKSKSSQVTDNHFQNIGSPRENEALPKIPTINSEVVPEEISSVSHDTVSKTSKSSQICEDILQSHSKSSKRSSKSIPTDVSKKSLCSSESKSNVKRRSSKCQKSKSSSSILTENILRSNSNSQVSEEFTKHYNKRTKMEKEFIQSDKNDENIILGSMDHDESLSSLQALIRHSKPSKDKNFKVLTDRIDDYDSKENILCQKIFDKSVEAYGNSFHSEDKSKDNLDNTSIRSRLSNFAVSHHGIGEGDRNYSKSVVIRSQDHNLKTSKKLEQILNAREAALASRKNCVEEWMAWHAKLRTEEERVARMEQAALKLVTATSKVFSQQERSVCPFMDTTVSSDTSDIEGRIELLTEKLAKRRVEMSCLKREARKQTKQKLRALEANLLNQIKKYDTTIYEMRKKLESKKGTSKDDDKLAIESKSLADFKVPEIPLKRIQDMFKNSDLLRSRSESDLLCTKRPMKDHTKNINLLRNESTEVEYDKNSSEKVTKYSRSVRSSEQLSSGKISTAAHCSVQSVLDNSISEQIESDKLGSASSVTFDDVCSDRSISYDSKMYMNEMQSKRISTVGKKSSISEDIGTDISTAKSEDDIITQSDAKLSKNEITIESDIKEYKSYFHTISEHSRAKCISSQSGTDKMQDSENSLIPIEKSDVEGSKVENNSECSNEKFNVSRKLDFLRLNNKNLYEDINSLENELKILSEMMSHFRKRSNENSKNNEDTSKDISDMLLKSEKDSEIQDMEFMKNDDNKSVEVSRKESNPDISQYLINGTKLKSVSTFNNDKNIVEEVDDVISVIMPKTDTSLFKSHQETDYKARSKEILNEIEKSIISEHIKTDSNRSNVLLESNKLSTYEGNEKLSHNTSSNNYMNSLSEDYLRATEDKESIITVENASEIVQRDEDGIYTVNSSSDSHNLARQQLLQSTQNLTSPNCTKPSEKSVLLVKDKLLNLCADIDHDLPKHNAITIQSYSEHSSHIISERFPQSVIKQTTVVQSGIELLKKPTSPQSVSSTEKTEEIEEVIDYTKDENLQNVSNSCSILKADHFELITDKCKNESNLLVANEVTECNENPLNSVKIAKEDISENTIGFIHKEVSKDKNLIKATSIDQISLDKDDWTISDSFDIQQDVNSEWEKSFKSQNSKYLNDDSSEFIDAKDISQSVDEIQNLDFEKKVGSGIEDISLFIPEGESTNIDAYGIKLDETISNCRINTIDNKIDDMFYTIVKDNDFEQNQEETVHTIETDDFQNAIYDSVTKILDKVEKSIDNNSIKEKIESNSDIRENENEIKATVSEECKSVSSTPNSEDELRKKAKGEFDTGKETFALDTNKHKMKKDIALIKDRDEVAIDSNISEEIEGNENACHIGTKSQEVVITELESGSIEDDILSDLEIDAKIEFVEEEHVETNGSEDNAATQVMQKRKSFELTVEQESSDGEQLDNLVEVTESGLATIEKQMSISGAADISHDTINSQIIEVPESKIENQTHRDSSKAVDNLKKAEKPMKIETSSSTDVINKTFNILKDPEYEDISEESLEVSEIFDKSELQKSVSVQKSFPIPERYEAVQKSEEVLRILDEITKQSSPSSDHNKEQSESDKQVSENSEKSQANISRKDHTVPSNIDDQIEYDTNKQTEQLFGNSLESQTSITVVTEDENQLIELIVSSNEIEEKEMQEQDASSESSEDKDTPKGVSEIEMDSPRDPNDSRLNIDTLNDDLLNNVNTNKSENADSKNMYHATPIVTTSEKDIEVMIDKLKASLEQPGLEVAELEAKLLRIEQLQIELEIKKLEAEEVSYYVREIPNKPPPPYTPPGGGTRISASLVSPSPPPAVIPSNIEELTAFTEKASALIFRAKEAGEDIMGLEAPTEIYELTKENDETVKKDRRIYNTFLFDLCKETIAEVYQAEYEKPGPSWTKPNVKTKPTMKIPKTIDELNEYVNKEVATLFGFKTKLQRENMVMRWSRKRRDRVDELLAREAQAEEDEWTKFHHDELAVKNGLTVAILDTLIMETVNIVKVAYAKKRKVV